MRSHAPIAPPISDAARPTWTTILKGAKPAALPFEQPTKFRAYQIFSRYTGH
jgi:hypothetical protein